MTENTITTRLTDKAASWAKYALLLLALIHLLLAGSVAINRMTSPVILDSAEAIHTQFAYQAGEGARLYGPLDIHVQELWYNPLSFQIAGYFSRLFNYDIRAIRFTMFLFGFGSICLVAMLTRQRTGSVVLASTAAAWASAIDAGPWIVEVGPNTGHIFFAMLAVYLLARDKSLRWTTVVLASTCLFASFWCKQTGLAYIVAGVFYTATRNLRKGLACATIAGGMSAVSVLFFVLQPDSSYISMTFLHKNHPIMWSWLWTPALYPELLGRMGILCGILAAALIRKQWRFRELLEPEYIFLGAAAIVGILTRIKYGSGPTQAILFYCLLMVCALRFLQDFFTERTMQASVIMGLLLVQSVTFARDWRPAYISNDDSRRFREIRDILATPGMRTHYVNQGILNHYVGKPVHAPVGRDCWKNGQYDKTLYPDLFRATYSKDPFDIVIIDIPLEDHSWFLYERLNANYVPSTELPPFNGADMTLRYRKIVFVRKDLAGAAKEHNSQ